jgi:hypothetical protein
LAVLDPPRTLLLTAGLSLLAGAAWAVLAAGLIYGGSRFLPPRLPQGSVWSEWRRKRMIWGLAPVLTGIGAYLTGEGISRGIGLRDLFWLTHAETIVWLGRLGGLFGYLLVLLAMVLVALRARRRKSPAPPAGTR